MSDGGAMQSRRIELSVIAPCFNEADNIPEFVSRTLRILSTKGISGELILVDDGSTDSSAQIIRKLEQENAGRVRAVYHETNQGLEQAWRSALEVSRGIYICLIDSDLQYQPEDIYRLYRDMKFSNVDLVQGTRSHIGRLKDGRYILSVGLNTILNICFGMKSRDNKSGFILCRRDVLAEILRHRHRYKYFQTFITVAAHAHRYSIREVETLFESRIHGKSFIKKRLPLGLIVDCLFDILKGIHEYRLAGYRDLLIERFVRTRLPSHAPSPHLRRLRRVYFNLYSWLMPLHHWMITRDASYYYRVLDRSQWLPPDDIRELQRAKLHRLINHAYWHVPYYREVMDARGLRPDDIRTIDDLAKLPLLEKQDVRENLYFDLMSDGYRKQDIYRISTSGSTGQPLTVWVDRHQLEFRWAATLRSQEWTGYRFGDRCIRLWHQTIGMTRAQVIKEWLDALLCRRKFVPAFELHSAKVREMEDLISRYRPILIDGYAESFHHLARQNPSRELRSLGIKGIISSAQTLDPESRKVIETAFGTRVFDKYGSREFSGIAYECPERAGHHVVSEGYIVEILVDGRPALPGELGEVVVTDLNNYVMPFVRYRIGDLAYAVDEGNPCPCGRGLARIGPVEGRVQSIILAANGVAMPGSFFLHVLKDYGYAFSRFQIEQVARTRIIFRYVPAPRFNRKVMDKVIGLFHEYLGSSMEIEEQDVDRIDLIRTGKHQVVINRLPFDYQSIQTARDPRVSRDA